MNPWARRGLLSLGVLGICFGITLFVLSNMVLYPFYYEHRTPEQGLRPLQETSRGFKNWQGKVHDPKRDLGLTFDEVQFSAADQQILRGWYIPAEENPDVAIVAVHGGGADRREFLRHVPLLHEAGYPVLLFDCREHGISDGTGKGISLGMREHEDVIAAVHYLKQERKIRKIAVIGTSQGGVSVILAAAKEPAILAVISENPYTSPRDLLESLVQRHLPEFPSWILAPAVWAVLYRIDASDQPGALEVVDKIAPRPLLLMHGTSDSMTPYEHSVQLFEKALPPKEFWTAKGASHAMLLNRYPKEYRAKVLRFLKKYLPSKTLASMPLPEEV